MSVTIIADLQIKPEETEWVIAFLLAVLPNTRKSAGCLGADLQQNQEDPNNLLIVQAFETRQDYENYMAGIRSADDPDGVMQRYVASFARPPVARYFNHIKG